MKPHELLDPDFHSFLNPGTDPWSLDTLPTIRRLSRAGVAVELHVYPGAPHMFDQNQDASLRNPISISFVH
ncbi:hypothetical protein [Pseudomonas umsongensis]|uniref:hypothetical protein n=1 Tax=Pseudomonas umsongensis TaxID=198618 RepID=UPI003D7F26D4